MFHDNRGGSCRRSFAWPNAYRIPTISIHSGLIVGSRYMRGCFDRLLLFGIEPDLREIMADVGATDQCRVTNRKLLSLVNSNPVPNDMLSPAADRIGQRRNVP